jgi:hypothetical protein
MSAIIFCQKGEIAEGNITLMIEEKKHLEKGVTNRKKLLCDKKRLKYLQAQKKKMIYQYRLKSKIFCYNTTSQQLLTMVVS